MVLSPWLPQRGQKAEDKDEIPEKIHSCPFDMVIASVLPTIKRPG
jgi:hypothetical protein